MSRPDCSTSDSFTFSTGLEGSASDWDGYRQLYETGGEVLRETDSFHAEIAATRLDRAIIFERRLRGLRHERRPEHLADTGFDHFTLQLNLGGEIEVDAGQGFEPLAVGEAILLDASLPMRLRLIDVHLITASLARGLVIACGEIGHGDRIPIERTAALRRRLDQGATGATDRLNLKDPRLVMLMLSMLAPDRPGQHRLRRRMIQRAVVRDYVEANLAERELDPSTIAHACAISRSTLYRLTDPDGGVASFVRKVRLARLERLLVAGDGGSLTDLAEHLGFADASHMSRQFRAVTGISPGRYRSASQDDVAADAALRRWSTWMAEFR